MKDKKLEVMMVDSLIANDYTLCLALALVNQNVKIDFVVPENREFNSDVPFTIKRWSPAKNDSYGKFFKTYKYFLYLMKVLMYSLYHRDIIVHFQFFRRRGDSILFYIMALLGAKLVYTAHNILPHEKGPVDKYLYQLVYKSAKGIIVHSGFIKEKLLKNFKTNREKVHVIPHGNFDIYLPPERMTKKEARQKLQLSEDDKVLLFFGLIRESKGLDVLLDAYDIAKDCDPGLKLLVIGRPVNDSIENRVLKRINEIAAGDRIIRRFSYIPSDEIQNYFEACDIVVLPYKTIDHSGIVHLAYSFSRPLIVSPVGDFPESIEHGKSGFVLKENTPASLSETILHAFSQNGRLAEMGLYAKYLNESKYSWDEIAETTASLYREILC